MKKGNRFDISLLNVIVISSTSLLFFTMGLSEILGQQMMNNTDISTMVPFNITEINQKNQVLVDKVTKDINLSNFPSFDQNQNTILYENKLINIQVHYPKNWLLTTSGLNSPHDFVSFIPPLDNLSDTSQGRLIFSIAKFNQNISIQSFKDLSRQVGESNLNSPGFQILKTANSTLMGFPAYSVLSLNNYNYPTQIIELNSWIATKDNTLYSVSYVSQPDKFIKYSDEVLKIVNSLKLIN